MLASFVRPFLLVLFSRAVANGQTTRTSNALLPTPNQNSRIQSLADSLKQAVRTRFWVSPFVAR